MARPTNMTRLFWPEITHIYGAVYNACVIRVFLLLLLSLCMYYKYDIHCVEKYQNDIINYKEFDYIYV